MKKRSIKKVLALGLAGAMLCGMLTACGGANGSSSAPSASSEGQAEPAAPRNREGEGRALASVDRCGGRILG